MGRFFRAAAVAALLLTLAPFAPLDQPAEGAGILSTYMTGLDWPVALAFSPDGRVFFAERFTGSIRVIENDVLLPAPLYTLADTRTVGEQGLLGLALDPGFPAVPWVYAYHTFDDTANGTVYNRIVRVWTSGNAGLFHEVVLGGIPAANIHNGGIIGFGSDQMLYAAPGDAATPSLAQDLTVRHGKTLRMHPDGTVPADNPFVVDPAADDYIYTTGHRNLFGLAFHPATGAAYVTENGPAVDDEVNLLVAGENYGWPVVTGIAGTPPYVDPLVEYTPTIAPTNAAVYAGPNFTQYQNDLIFGDWNTGSLRHLDLAPPDYDAVVSESVILTVPQGILDVESGPDGALWFTTPTTIYRYVDTAQPPTAAFTATPNPVNPGATVTFDASASTDPDGTLVGYAWEFGDGATGAGIVATHGYAAPGTYAVNLTVTDNESLQDTTTVEVYVNAPPVAAFAATPSPADVGTAVEFNATASIDPDGTLVNFSWDFGDGATASGLVVFHAFAANGTYDVTLTVRDNLSLEDSVTQPITILNASNALPIPSFTFTPQTPVAGGTVQFDASASRDPDGAVVSYAWDFGNGDTGSGVTASATYLQAGTYTVTLNVTDDQGASSTATRAVVVSLPPNQPPTASFDYVPLAPAAKVLVTFDAGASSDPDGEIVRYRWDFGDGTVREGVIAEHAWAEAGRYAVQLVVFDDRGGQGFHNTTVEVTGPGPPDDAFGLLLPLLVIAVVLVVAVLAILLRLRRRSD